MTAETLTHEGKGKTRAGKPMSDEHKAALAEGRKYGKVVSDYLEALDQQKPRRGRKANAETIRERIAALDEKIPTAKGTERLTLIQYKMDLETQLQRSAETHDLNELEREFVKVAKPYAERKGFTYTAFREVGVPANVLKEAGIDRKVA